MAEKRDTAADSDVRKKRVKKHDGQENSVSVVDLETATISLGDAGDQELHLV